MEINNLTILLVTIIFAIFYYFFSFALTMLKDYTPGIIVANKGMVIQLIVLHILGGYIYYIFQGSLKLTTPYNYVYIFLQLSALIYITTKTNKLIKSVENKGYREKKKTGLHYYYFMIVYVIISGVLNAAFARELYNELTPLISEKLTLDNYLIFGVYIIFFLLPLSVVFFNSGMLYTSRQLYILEKYQIFLTNDVNRKYPGLRDNKSICGYIFKIDNNNIWIKVGNAPLFCIKNDYVEGMKKLV